RPPEGFFTHNCTCGLVVDVEVPGGETQHVHRLDDGSPIGSNDRTFHTTVLPIKAGAVGRFPAMAVKLKGVIASTKPSRGRWSRRFHTPGLLTGCSSRICRAKATLNRQKSAISHAESISAW